jgi:Uncharacterized conserved protein
MSEEQILQNFETELTSLIQSPNYPCIAALKTLSTSQYRMGVYGELGSGKFSRRLAEDLIAFKEAQKDTGSLELSLFAVFPDLTDFTEEEFEDRLWQELSYLTGHAGIDTTWDPRFSDNPEDENFCFSLAGSAYFVVGLHKNSSRLSRRLTHPTLVFNVYEQFRELDRRGRYQAMIAANRKRDLQFQGSVNPMSEKYNDVWESIQFSGRNNSAEWRCPFSKGLKS